MTTLVIIYISFALAYIVNHRINMYLETKEQQRLENLERELEEDLLNTIAKAFL